MTWDRTIEVNTAAMSQFMELGGHEPFTHIPPIDDTVVVKCRQCGFQVSWGKMAGTWRVKGAQFLELPDCVKRNVTVR